jgi:hypothetical protein
MQSGKSQDMEKQRQSGAWRPALMLFFMAPLVGEFLLGNLSITWLWVLFILAPMYGGGALLVRETARRLGLGWPGIFALSLGYAIIEEAFVTQSLFNPNYVGLRLLDYGYISSLGIGAWWTVFVLGIHVIWSMATPIALVEALAGKRRHAPWLSPAGIVMVVLLFLLGCFGAAAGDDPFRASNAQFIVSGVVVVLIFAAALIIKWVFKAKPLSSAAQSVPDLNPRNPLVVGIIALLMGSGFMSLALINNAILVAVNVLGMLAIVTSGGLIFDRWSRNAAWTPRHELAIAGGFLFTYAWYGFAQMPSVGEVAPTVDAIGNAIFTAAAVGAFVVAWKRTR